MEIDFKNYTDPSYFIKEMEVDPSWVNDLGNEYHEYRKRWDNASKNLYLYDFPLCLEVESSYACNFKCPECPRFAASVPKEGVMSVETFSMLMKECATEKLDSIFLDHGGEALLNKNLPQFANMCRKAGIIDIMISTNASLLSRELSRALVEEELTKINFSIDAAGPETYSVTRPGGVYERTVENILSFLDEKKKRGRSYPRVRVSFIVQDSNRHELKEFYELWKDKVNIISFQDAKNYNEILGDGGGKRIDSSNYKFKCYQPFTNLMIDWKGGIHACNHDYNHKFVIGNIRECSLKKAWHSEIMDEFRKAHLDGKWDENEFCFNCVRGSKN